MFKGLSTLRAAEKTSQAPREVSAADRELQAYLSAHYGPSAEDGDRKKKKKKKKRAKEQAIRVVDEEELERERLARVRARDVPGLRGAFAGAEEDDEEEDDGAAEGEGRGGAGGGLLLPAMRRFFARPAHASAHRPPLSARRSRGCERGPGGVRERHRGEGEGCADRRRRGLGRGRGGRRGESLAARQRR